MVMTTPATRRVSTNSTNSNSNIPPRSTNNKYNAMPLFPSSSSSTKLALLAVLALLFLNLNASSVISRSAPSSSSSSSSRWKSSSSLRKRPRNTQQRQTERYHVGIDEGYAADSTFSEDDNDSMDDSTMDVEYSPALPLPDSEGEDDDRVGDIAPIGAAELNDEGSFRGEEWRNEVKRTKGRGEKGNIAWLMSFPNSGTSFTSLLVRHASNATTATNYGMESHLGTDGTSVPVYARSAEGPYWLHPPRRMERIDDTSADAFADTLYGGNTRGYNSGTKLGKSGAYDTPPTSASILTKTHCGSRCTFCPPGRYLETPASFLQQCLTGSRKVTKRNPKRDTAEYEKRYHTYHPSLVSRAVHLLRDPFDNLVSRFHHEQKEHAKKGENRWSSRYSNDVFGFRRWCADEDVKYAAAERDADWAAYGYSADLPRRFEGVSCHGELFRYVQWHGLATEAADALDVPVLHVYYENYSIDLKGETGRMLDFLGLEVREERLPEFDSEKDYSAFFTREERAIASDFMRRVASGGARELLERYWVELDFELLRKQTKSIK